MRFGHCKRIVWGRRRAEGWNAAPARLASVLTTLHNMFEEDAARILGIPFADYMQTGILAVAYPDSPDFKPAYREPIDRFIHWNSW